MKKAELLNLIAKFSPIIIASDTNPPSKLCKTLAANFKCRCFHPNKSLTIFEKIRLTKSFNFRNTHERDSIASALKAYHRIANKMRQVESKIKIFSPQKKGKMNLIKASVVSGKRMSDFIY